MPVLATCDLHEKCKKAACQMFWLHGASHVNVFRLAVVLLEIQDFKINKFCFNLFLFFKNVV